MKSDSKYSKFYKNTFIAYGAYSVFLFFGLLISSFMEQSFLQNTEALKQYNVLQFPWYYVLIIFPFTFITIFALWAIVEKNSIASKRFLRRWSLFRVCFVPVSLFLFYFWALGISGQQSAPVLTLFLDLFLLGLVLLTPVLGISLYIITGRDLGLTKKAAKTK